LLPREEAVLRVEYAERRDTYGSMFTYLAWCVHTCTEWPSGMKSSLQGYQEDGVLCVEYAERRET